MSLALHATVLVLLLLHPPGGPPQGESSPTADIAMVFQPADTSAAPPTSKPARAAGSAPAAPAERPGSSPPVAAAPQASRPESIAPPRPAQPVHRPVAPPVSANPPALGQQAQPRRTAARPAAHPGRLATSRFPSPIMRSFFIPSGAPTAAHPFSEAFAAGEAAAPRGAQRDSPFDLRGAEQLGPDWNAALLQWVEEHAHYPEQAAANGEDGDSSVQMTIDRYGRVTSLRIVQPSGSVWLDAGLTGMFRDARLPPFPPGTPDRLTIIFTLHYILER